MVVEIEDTGSGMPPEVQARLFTPFFTTKPAGVGTGLGLSICQRIVTTFGGEITVTSELGSGTTFRVALPVSGATLEAAPPRVARQLGTRRGRVLVIDDEPMLTNIVRRSIGRVHDVQTSPSATHALARFRAGERYDVILCDLMMPEITGMELHHALGTIAPEQVARVVFMTGGAFTTVAREFLDRVDNAVVEKPFHVASLLELVSDRIR